MAAYDVAPMGPGEGLRSGVTASQLARAEAEWNAARAQNDRSQNLAITVLAIVIVLTAVALLIHRRRIGRAADEAVVSSLASAVKAARKADSSRRAWLARILAKANEPSPPSP